MSKHTPGPWKISESSNDVEQDSEAQFGICAIYADESSSANARLIAAAPDLLAACEKLVEIAPKLWGPTSDDWPRIMNRVEAAIAKATE